MSKVEKLASELRRSGLLGEQHAARFARLGHFAYEGGDHGDTALALELLFADPRRLQLAAARLAAKLRPYSIDVVCGPLVGGALVGQWVARELRAGFVYAEPTPDLSGGRRYAVPIRLRPALDGKRAVIVDDVINAGSAASACAREIGPLGSRVVAAASLIVRDSSLPDVKERLDVPVEALLVVPWNTWHPSECPLCKSGVELESAR